MIFDNPKSAIFTSRKVPLLSNRAAHCYNFDLGSLPIISQQTGCTGTINLDVNGHIKAGYTEPRVVKCGEVGVGPSAEKQGRRQLAARWDEDVLRP